MNKREHAPGLEKPKTRQMSLTELRSLLGKKARSTVTARFLQEVQQAHPSGNFPAKIGYWGDGSISSVFVQTRFDSVRLSGRVLQIRNGEVLSAVNRKPIDIMDAYTGITFLLPYKGK